MFKALARKHLDTRLSELQSLTVFSRPPSGWIKAIREAIGMTAAQLAHRLKVSQPRVVTIEKDEIRGAVTLETMSRTAQALDCTFVYTLIPNTTLEKMVREQAKKKATEQLATIHHTMQLEDQALSNTALEKEIERRSDALQKGNLKGLWNP